MLGPLLTVYSGQACFSNPDLAGYILGALTTLATGNSLPGLFAALPEAGNVNEPLWTLKYELAAYCSVGLVIALSIVLHARAFPCATAMVVTACLTGFATLPLSDLPGATSNALNLFLSFCLGVAA